MSPRAEQQAAKWSGSVKKRWNGSPQRRWRRCSWTI